MCIIMDHSINALVNENNVVDEINGTDKHC